MKTKELLIDFKKNHVPVPDLVIDGVKVERVNEYKYLGTVLDEKLNFTANTDFIHRKCQSRMYFLQKLRNLDHAGILQIFTTASSSLLSRFLLCVGLEA